MANNSESEVQQSSTNKSIAAFYTSREYLLPKKISSNIQGRTRKRPVLLVIPEMSGIKPSPCSYIRLLTPLMSPEIQGAFEVRIATLKSALAIAADVVIINRVPCENATELECFLAHLRQIGAKLIYEIDDQLLNLPDDHPEVAVYKKRQCVVLKLLSEADLVWTSTTLLSEALNPLCKQIATFENYLDLNLWEGKAVRTTQESNARKKFNILYMGTTTHSTDLNLVLDAMDKLHSEGEVFELHLIGISTTAPQYSWIKVIHPPASATSYPEFMRWLRSLQMFDLGIAPLETTDFNHCKSSIKYWDYSSLGVPTLASNVEAYNNIIVDGITGYLANNNTGAWYAKLRNAMTNKNQLNTVVANAIKSLKKRYAQLNGAESRKKSILELLEILPDKNAIPDVGNSLTAPVSREEIAVSFLSGIGIEVGALHNPLPVPIGAKVRYVDRMDKPGLYEQYPELRQHNLVDVDFVDNGETLLTFSENSQDFIIANHFLEHCEDPIGTLKSFFRVLRTGGIVFLALPDKRFTFDKNRQRTSLAHLIRDHLEGPINSRFEHFREWPEFVEPHFGRIYASDEEIDIRARELMNLNYSIHFHVWEPVDVHEMLEYCADEQGIPLAIEYFLSKDDEMIFILKKNV